MKELKKHLFDLSIAIDKYSVAHDYKALRETHYNNMSWIEDAGLMEEYYKEWLKDMNDRRDEE